MATKQNKAKKLRFNFRKCMMRLINMIGNYTYIHTYIIYYWRASTASETLTGVTQLKIGDVCLFVYMYGCTYVILYFDPRVFVLVMWSIPSQIALNRILWFIDQYPYHPRN